jgi:hypothetical protein
MDRVALVKGLRMVLVSDFVTIARDAQVVVVLLRGDIDDDKSDRWRAAVAQSFVEDGRPPYAIVDTSAAIATSTLPTRMRTAAFLRENAQRMKSVAIVASTSTGFAVKATMRVAGLGNVRFIEDAHADDALAPLLNEIARTRAAETPAS